VSSIGAGFSFSCSREEGALLLPRAKTDRVALEDTTYLRRYIKQNYDHWCAFAIEEGWEHEVSQSLITMAYGCDKGSAWATAAFTSKSTGGSLHFSISPLPGLAPSGQLQGSWTKVTESSVTCGLGPEDELKMPRSSPSISGHVFGPSCAYTFFIRSFRIKKGLTRFNSPKILEGSAGPHDLGDSHFDWESSNATLIGPRSSPLWDEQHVPDLPSVRS
jgi:hypothetical protein